MPSSDDYQSQRVHENHIPSILVIPFGSRHSLAYEFNFYTVSLVPMDSPVSAISYLARAKQLLSSTDKASLIYAALELRCGVEARLKEHAAVATAVSKTQLGHYEIRKLSKTVQEAFGLGDKLLIVQLELIDGRLGEFTYAPVTTQLQGIAVKLGDYLHAVPHERVIAANFWTRLQSMLSEGCGLLELACSSEILRPTFEHGLHFCLLPGDPRIEIVMDYQRGVQGSFRTITIEPLSNMTYYPGDGA